MEEKKPEQKQSLIISNPKILGGKPVINGTRIPVDQILTLLTQGFTIEAIHEEYPQLNTQVIAGTVTAAAELLNKNASKIL